MVVNECEEELINHKDAKIIHKCQKGEEMGGWKW